MAEVQDPLVQRRRVRTELRKARTKAGLTQKEVATALDWSLSKVIRIETGAVSISTTDLQALLRHYKTPERRIAELVEWARAGRGQPAGWWNSYKEIIGQEFQTHLALESAASIIRQFHPLIVPGLLQTEAYAQAILEVFSDDKVERKMQLRMERQGLLDRPEPPEMFFILGEAAIRQWIGGPAVMGRQLERLKELAQHPRVSIQMVRFDAGAHPGLKGPFVILDFPDSNDDPVLFLENSRGDTIIRDDADEASAYIETFWRLEDMACSKEEVGSVIDEAIGLLPSPVSD